jgi:hypothetical protein
MDSTINCRKNGSLFDVSHMCGLSLKGIDAIAFIEKLVVGDIAGLKDNSGSLSVFTNEKGGIIDDTVVTKVQLQTLLSCLFRGSCRPLSSKAVVLCVRCLDSFSICFKGLVRYQVILCRFRSFLSQMLYSGASKPLSTRSDLSVFFAFKALLI